MSQDSVSVSIIFYDLYVFFYSGEIRCGGLSGCVRRMAGSRNTAGRRESRCIRDNGAAPTAERETSSLAAIITIKHTRGKWNTSLMYDINTWSVFMIYLYLDESCLLVFGLGQCKHVVLQVCTMFCMIYYQGDRWCNWACQRDMISEFFWFKILLTESE